MTSFTNDTSKQSSFSSADNKKSHQNRYNWYMFACFVYDVLRMRSHLHGTSASIMHTAVSAATVRFVRLADKNADVTDVVIDLTSFSTTLSYRSRLDLRVISLLA
jgi:hypothetical protein